MVGTPSLPKALAAESPAGPPPITNTLLAIFNLLIGFKGA